MLIIVQESAATEPAKIAQNRVARGPISARVKRCNTNHSTTGYKTLTIMPNIPPAAIERAAQKFHFSFRSSMRQLRE